MTISTYEDVHGIVHRVTRVMNDANGNATVAFTPCMDSIGGFWMHIDVVHGSRRPNCLGCIAEEE